MGIYTAYDKENGSEEKLEELYQFGKSLCVEKPPVDMTIEEFRTAFISGEPVRLSSKAMAF